jgi:hypothetical protein
MSQPTTNGTDIMVELSRFKSDPEHYMREANSQRRVVVHHDKTQKISAVFGGPLDVPPSIEETK